MVVTEILDNAGIRHIYVSCHGHLLTILLYIPAATCQITCWTPANHSLQFFETFLTRTTALVVFKWLKKHMRRQLVHLYLTKTFSGQVDFVSFVRSKRSTKCHRKDDGWVHKVCDIDVGDHCLHFVFYRQSAWVCFNHDHNLSLTLTKYFFCLNLTKPYFCCSRSIFWNKSFKMFKSFEMSSCYGDVRSENAHICFGRQWERTVLII